MPSSTNLSRAYTSSNDVSAVKTPKANGKKHSETSVHCTTCIPVSKLSLRFNRTQSKSKRRWKMQGRLQLASSAVWLLSNRCNHAATYII